MAKTAVGLVETRQSAEQLVDDLLQNGFQQEDISLVAQEERGQIQRIMKPWAVWRRGQKQGPRCHRKGNRVATQRSVVASPR